MQKDIETRWVYCPKCGKRIKVKIRNDTKLFHYILYCTWCKKESLINLENFEIRIVQEDDTRK